MNQDQRHRRRRHPLEPRSLAQRCRPRGREPFPGLVRKSVDGRVVEVVRQPQRLVARVFLDLPPLAVDIPGIPRLDLDLQFGSIPLYFDLYPKRGLLQALENIEDLDDATLSAYLVRSAAGVEILGQSADDAMALGSGPINRLNGLLRLVCASREHVVVDLPRRMDPFADQVLSRARYVVVVVQQSVTVLRDATRLLNYLRRDLGVDQGRLLTVVNRYEKNSVVSSEDVRRALGGGELVLVPNDFRSASECIATGHPLLEQFRGAALTKAVIGLAHRIAGSTPDRPGVLARTFSSFIKPRAS